jgi:2-deoxy-D-gluconate 3-dehydrogenase
VSNLFDVAGKTVLITGGNGGLGKGMALAFRDAGANVAVTGRDPAKNAGIAEEFGAEVALYTLDVRDESAVRETVAAVAERFGTLDVLVNNAGISGVTKVLEMEYAQWRAVLETHLNGAFLCAQAAGQVMARQVELGVRHGGKIINIGSLYSLFGPPNVAHYATAKTGMIGLTRALAVELAAWNIQVNAILPGFIETDLNRDRLRAGLGPYVVKKTPARRLGEASDIAAAALYLASPGADFVTGAALPVDGGYSVADRFWEE